MSLEFFLSRVHVSLEFFVVKTKTKIYIQEFILYIFKNFLFIFNFLFISKTGNLECILKILNGK